MATEWKTIIGDYKVIAGNPVKTLLGKSLYLTVLKHFDSLLDSLEQEEDKFYMYERLSHAVAADKKSDGTKEKPTYKGVKKVKKTVDGTEIVVEEEGNLALKKFANLTADVKTGLLFLLHKYVHECYTCYVDNKLSFANELEVLKQVSAYSKSHLSMPIAPFIIKISEVIDVESIVEGNFANILKQLCDKLRGLFKNEEDRSPEKQIGVLVDAYIRFLKIIALFTTDFLFESRQAVNEKFLFGILRQFNTIMKQYHTGIDEEFFATMKDYINVNKAADSEKAEKPKSGAKSGAKSGSKPGAKSKSKSSAKTENGKSEVEEGKAVIEPEEDYQDPNYMDEEDM